MWPFRHRSESVPPDLHSPGPRGLAFLIATLALLYFASSWLRGDPRFAGAIELTAALRYVLTEGAIEATPEAVFQAAANGLTATLDPFSAYMPAAELSYFEEETEGEYIGIGVEIKITAGTIVIVRVLPQTSAAEALLQPGDRITAIDDTPTAGFTLLRAIEMMRGPEGSTVELEIESPSGQNRRLTLERRAVMVSPFPIQGISRSGSAYIRWTDFSQGSADRLAAIVDALATESPIGLILDLRGNPGGLLEEAVSAAGVFLPPNTLVCRVIDRAGLNSMEYRTSESPSTFAKPLVVVMDENAASASEVLAAVLQESGRAVVVGRRSFGKGWVQNVFPFEDGSALRLSTARYYTPNGRTFGDPTVRLPSEDADFDSLWFEPTGLEPDSVVALLPVGRWEEELAARGLFADFALAHLEDWPAFDLLDVLAYWCDSLGIVPNGLGADLTKERRRSLARLPDDSVRGAWERVVLSLDSAQSIDRDILFEREAQALSLCLWEQRMLAVERPDIDELDEYLSFDPDLSVARDLLEQPDRYHELTQRGRDRTLSATAAP
jgi:carboxyl-terminal processing protease